MQVLIYLAYMIGIFGVSIITWGILLALIRFILLEVKRLKSINICRERELLRHHLGSYLLLGLEFLIAADIIQTIIEPSLQEVAILGSIVGIRTILNFFLNRELASHSCQDITSSTA